MAVECRICHNSVDSDLVLAGPIKRNQPLEYHCRNERACMARLEAKITRCRDCGTTEHIIKWGEEAYRCSDYARCTRNQRLKFPANCADCGMRCDSGTWHTDHYGRKVCNVRPDCHARRGVAELRGVSTYSDKPPLDGPIPDDASDLYPSAAYEAGFRAVKYANSPEATRADRRGPEY